MNIKKSRKGSENWPVDTAPFYIPFAIVLGVAGILFFIFVYKQGYEQSIIHSNIERDNLLIRFVKSPECFAYHKDGVLMAGVIDAEKFSQQSLNSCYDTNSKNKPAFKISMATSVPGLVFPPITTKNYDTNRNPEKKIDSVGVNILIQGKLYRGEMQFELQNTQ